MCIEGAKNYAGSHWFQLFDDVGLQVRKKELM
jgi:hypothetical protein